MEVNAAPGLRMHLNPSYGKGRDIGNPIVSELYAPGEDGRIPLVAVTGVNGKTTTTRMIAHVLAAQGLCVGMTNTDGVYVGTRQTDSGDCSGPKSARNVLSHPHVQAAVLECARGGILREGLGFDRCSVAVVTNVGTGDHLGLNHIHTVEGIARVKKVIVQNVAPSGYAVLNAADPLVAAMGDECPGQVIYFARDSHHPVSPRTAAAAVAWCSWRRVSWWPWRARCSTACPWRPCPSHMAGPLASRWRTPWPPWPPVGD